ncbi:hypothetical protein [Jannaschia seohaensis]|uniref:hypothetical protein n=1 Tax=Jannaschia seohaensis TaxID=475081 RepID=UPI000D6B4E83|nr:hypothetical protein [Jannaschia seohaensis]
MKPEDFPKSAIRFAHPCTFLIPNPALADDIEFEAVWNDGSIAAQAGAALPLDDVLATGEQIAQSGMFLFDVELERFNGETFYHGVFRTEVTNSTTKMSPPMPRPAFTAERDTRIADGQELVDMETVEIGGEVLYVGLWRQGDGPSAVSALRDFGAFGPFAAEQTAAGRTLADLELRRVVPDQQPPPTGVSTADFPDTPDWIEFRSGAGSRDITIRFSPTLPPPNYRLSLHVDQLPVLPLDETGFPVMPDNFCGLRIFDPDRTLWLDEDNHTIDTPQSPNPSFPTVDYSASTELETFALSGVTFTGPMGACAGSNDPWRFDFPLTDTSTGGPPNRTFVADLASEVAFLNHNVPLETPFQPGLKPKDYFKPEIADLIKAIAKAWEEGEDGTGYCESLADFVDALCEAGDQSCPLENPSENC